MFYIGLFKSHTGALGQNQIQTCSRDVGAENQAPVTATWADRTYVMTKKPGTARYRRLRKDIQERRMKNG